MMGGMMRGMGQGKMAGGMFSINGRSMDINRIDFSVKHNTSEIWHISNPSPMAHPFHVHNTQFQILSRNGKRPAAHELGLKDTVLVNSSERVEILVPFPDYVDRETPYMYHCHILEHEDQGMMGQFTVT